MRYAQWISTVIYLVFIGLASVSFASSDVSASETAIIQMMRVVAPTLPFLLVLAALASQFSAAVADTNGSGGLASEMTRGKVSSRWAYVIVVAASLALTWTADIYQIISYASRAFAGYYMLQCALAAVLSHRAKNRSPKRRAIKTIFYCALAVLAFAILILGIPAE